VAVIVIAATNAPVLAVPVAALYTTASGQTVVTVMAHGIRTDVPVRVGAETGGYVPVRPLHGTTLAAGDRVLVGQ
jgi:multidrug efflux pump subunit AcrA (membrane-fusion protein)